MTEDPLAPGLYSFTTATGSRYELIVGQHPTLSRAPGTAPVHPSMDGHTAMALRCDAEPIPVLKVLQLQVGAPAIFVIKLHPDFETVRETSEVMEIAQEVVL